MPSYLRKLRVRKQCDFFPPSECVKVTIPSCVLAMLPSVPRGAKPTIETFIGFIFNFRDFIFNVPPFSRGAYNLINKIST